MQEGVAVVFEQLIVHHVIPAVAGAVHQVLVDLRQLLHAGHTADAGAVLLALDDVHNLLQALAQGILGLVLVAGHNVGGEVHAGVVAHLEGGVQGVVIFQEPDLVPAGADPLAQPGLLLEGGRQGDGHAVAQLDVDGHGDGHAQTGAL